MFLLIFYILFLCIFMVCPLLGKIALLILNLIIGDPLPYIDEFIMAASTLSNISSFIRNWEEHKLAIIIGAGVVVFLFVKYVA